MIKNKVVDEGITEVKTQDYGKVGSKKYFDLAQEDFNNPKLKWTKVTVLNKEKDGYSGTVHRRPLEGDTKGCNIMRADIKYKNVKIDWYLIMTKNGPPMEKMVERRFIKDEDGYRYFYLRVKIGSFASDREVVVRKKDHL